MHDGTIIQGTEAEFRRYAEVWICAACGRDAIERREAGRLVLHCRGCANWAMGEPPR